MSLSILIVEDEALSAMVLERRLAREGHAILKSVATGEEAIQAALVQRPDVILMDIQLAGSVDGIDAALAIRAGHDFRLIFMSGYHDGEYRTRAMALKPHAYLVKPLDIDRLVRSIVEPLA